MHNSKLIRSLRQLSTRQLSRFGAFLASPYFNKQTNNITFFDWLVKYAPAFSHPALAVDKLLADWPFDFATDRKKIRYLLSDLNGLLEQFLVVESLTADPSISFFRKLQQEAGALGIEHLQQRAERKIRRILEETTYKDSQYYEQLYQYHLDQYGETDPYQRSFNPQLQTASDSLDTYYLISRLRFAWQMRHQEAVTSERYQHHFAPELLKWLDTHPAAGEPAAIMYALGLRMLEDPETVDHYYQFKNALQEHGMRLPPAERKLLYTGLLNYCIRRGNQHGETEFLREYLSINELLMEQGLLLEDGEISPWRFVNLKMAALRVQEDEWAWKFIHDYQGFLPEAYRENVFRYALAYLHFYRKDYEQARQLLAQVQFEDLLFNVALRTLLVRVYYEAGEIETLLIPQLEANRLFLIRHRGELAPKIYEQWRNFNKRCGQLAKWDRDADTDWAGIRTVVATTPLLLHKDWLLACIDQRLKDR
jgi:hypothetical protein